MVYNINLTLRKEKDDSYSQIKPLQMTKEQALTINKFINFLCEDTDFCGNDLVEVYIEESKENKICNLNDYEENY